MPLLGALVNAGAIVLGGLIGLLIRLLGRKKRSTGSGRFQDIVMKGVALCVAYIGISGLLKGQNVLIAIISVVLGGLLGEACRLEDGINKVGQMIEQRFGAKDTTVSVTQGFVTASLLFCVGAMAIVGSLNSGIQGDHTMQYTKALLDGVSAIIFASSLGYGVLFSAGAVFLIQGGITLLARAIAPYLSEVVIAEMTCVGSLLILGLALNLLGITKLKVMNYVPAVFLPILLCQFM
ncbi:MAG: DUF554 domain-containing protein [Clostridia bacterium]|nr:DUF554 domain-containing protein [Clostridia bacterium]